MQQQQGSQYGGVSPDLGSAPRTQMLAAGGGGSEQAEAASPISSRPPASIMNFDDLVDDTDRAGSTSSGNRWPRQETVALLKIRSEMDSAFRDATLKGPLWEEVSRKLGELGYVRSGKKCKEKFENVHKYYKRTKEGRAGRQDGKTYRFFTHLEALQALTASGSGSGSTNLIPSSTTPPPPPLLMTSSGPLAAAASPHRNMQFATPVSVGIGGNIVMQREGAAPPSQPFTMYSRDLSMGAGVSVPGSMSAAAPAPSVAPVGISFSSGSSSSGSYDSDEDEEEVDDVSEEERPSSTPVGSGQKRKRGYSFSSRGGGGTKRRMMDFFEGLMKQVMQKQEAMQQRFLEAIEKREQDRMMREEAWKRQEAARLSREQELMVQERATAAARDAAIVSFLQKITGQTIQLPQPVSHQNVAVTPAAPPPSVPTMPPAAPAPIPSSTSPPSRQQFQQKQHKSQQQKQQQQHQPQNTDLVRQHQMPPPPSTEAIMAVPERQIPPQDPPSGGGGGSYSEAASSRWPKVEVLALIKLRSNLENRYQEAGPKGPLWEEISAGMRQMGYSRSSKRCKEKWENINKYFKKVKESNKKRPEDAKTCPYFNELDALYQKKILGGAYSGSSSIMVPFQQQQQPQQGLSVDQSKNQETSISNVGVVQTSAAAQVESADKRDGTDLEQPNNGGLPDSIFEDQGGNAGATGGSRKDIMMELIEQQQGQLELNLDEFDKKIDELGNSRDNVEEEDRKVAYKMEFQRPPSDNENGGKQWVSSSQWFGNIIKTNAVAKNIAHHHRQTILY